MQILIMGPPGAGKGTQAAFIEEDFNIPQISTGDIFRKAIKEGSELGKRAKACIDSGSLVPDDITCAIVKERLSKPDCANGFILDGFPRTVKQAETLSDILKESGKKLSCVLNINVPESVLTERATGRRICKNCGATYHLSFNPPNKENICNACGGTLYQRTDDSEATVLARLKIYRQSTLPLIEYYKAKDLYKEVDGTRSIQEVRESLQRILRSAKE